MNIKLFDRHVRKLMCSAKRYKGTQKNIKEIEKTFFDIPIDKEYSALKFLFVPAEEAELIERTQLIQHELSESQRQMLNSLITHYNEKGWLSKRQKALITSLLVYCLVKT